VIESLLLPGLTGPRTLTQETAKLTDDPSNLRIGTVTEVTSRGIRVAVANGTVGASHLSSYSPAVGDICAMMQSQDTWVALGRIVGPVTPTDNQSPGTGVGMTILDAMVSSGGGGTLASSTGSLVTTPKFDVTFFHPPGHVVLVFAGFNWYGNTTGDWIMAQLWETTTNTQVGQFVDIQSSSSFGRADWIFGAALDSFGGAERTYVLKFQRLSGTGTVRMDDSTTNRPFMVAYDLGDTSVIRVV
jgi:hypothetical protein